jgi:putative toxin-antitoxin system antitoxin component (TIGR02293 family)
MAKYNEKKTAGKLVVKDQNAVYARKAGSLKVIKGQVGQVRPGNQTKSVIEKIEFVRKGVTKKFLVKIKEKTDLDYDKLAKVLSVGRATLINKNGNKPFNLPLSDRIVGLADLYEYGYEVFGDIENFNEWMVTSNHALGGMKPYDLIDTQYGKDEVRHLIGRIDYGVFS